MDPLGQDWRVTIVPSMGALSWVRNLGRGAEGSAELYIVKATGKTVVVKKHLDESKKRNRPTKRITSEINIAFSVLQGESWFTCRHHTWYFEDEPSVARIVSEFCAGGDLDGVIVKYLLRMARFPESLVWHVFLHIGTALVFLHTGRRYDPESGKFIDETVEYWNPVLHRDVRVPNILIRFNDILDGTCHYPDFILNDLGLAAPLHEHRTSMFEGCMVDPVYEAHTIPDPHCPPEVHDDGDRAEEKSRTQGDWWMLGCVLREVMNLGIPALDIMVTKFSEELKTLVQNLTDRRPHKRFSDEQAFNELPRAQELRDEWMRKEGSPFPGWAFGRAQPATKKERAAEAFPKVEGTPVAKTKPSAAFEQTTPVYEEHMLEDIPSDRDDSMEDEDDSESSMSIDSAETITNNRVADDNVELQLFY